MVSGQVCSGDFLVNSDDLSAVTSCATITGSLTIVNGSATSLSFPNLVNMTSLSIGVNTPLPGPVCPPSMTSVSFPALKFIMGNSTSSFGLRVRNCATLVVFSFPILELVGEEINILDNAMLKNVSFPSLTRIVDLEIRRNAQLNRVSFPSVALFEKGFDLDNNAVLTTVDMPELTTTTGNIKVQNNAALQRFTLPSLANCTGDFECFNNVALTVICMPNLKTIAPKDGTCDGVLVEIRNNSAAGLCTFPNFTSIIPDDVACTTDISGVSSTPCSAACAGNCQGDFVVSSDDISSVVNCSSIDGTLCIVGGSATTLSFPNLVNVSELNIAQGVLNSIAEYCPQNLTSISFPSLTAIFTNVGEYGLRIQYCSRLASISFPLLAIVNRSIELFDNPSLLNASFPLLTEAKELMVERNAIIQGLFVPELVTLGTDFNVKDNPLLTALSIPKLTVVPDMKVTNNSVLTTVYFPAARNATFGLEFRGNAALKVLCAPNLLAISATPPCQGGLVLQNNSAAGLCTLPVNLSVLVQNSCPAVTEVLNFPCTLQQCAAQEPCTGDVTLASDNLTSVGDCVNYTGRIEIVGGSASTISLPNLERVTALVIGNALAGPSACGSSVTSISFPALKQLTGGGFTLQKPRLTIRGCSALISISFPRLEAVPDDLTIWDNAVLTTATFPVMNQIQELQVRGNALLALLSFPEVLAVTKTFRLEANPALVDFLMPKVVRIQRVTVAGNAAMQHLSLPALVNITSGLTISNNSALSVLCTPALTGVVPDASCPSILIDIQNNAPGGLCTTLNLTDLLPPGCLATLTGVSSILCTTVQCPPISDAWRTTPTATILMVGLVTLFTCLM